MLRERQADFATGSVRDVSFTRRPDAVVSLVARAPGPRAVGDTSDGLLARAWYARHDNGAGKVYLAAAADEPRFGWQPEIELFSYAGDPVDALSLAFDVAGRPVVSMERAGHVWIRYHNGAAYVLSDLGVGVSPAIVHQAPDSEVWRDLVLLYERAAQVYYRLGSASYAAEHDALTGLAADQHIEAALLDSSNRLHILLSTRNAAAGQYSLQRKSSDFSPPCMDASGVLDRVDDGIETEFVFTSDGEITCTCEIQIDALLIGGGGDSGGDDGGDTILWASVDGVGLDPLTDTPPDAHRALGGGAGGLIDQDGRPGGSGGGGGAQSPSNNTMWSAGGLGTSPQGNNGGGGRSTWGLLPTKSAGSGGGGGYGGPGGGGSLEEAGQPGLSAPVPGWPWSGPRGGRGAHRTVHDPTPTTGPQSGGGGAGGVRVITGLIIQPGQRIPITVSPGIAGAPGVGGSRGSQGAYGMAAVRVRTSTPTTPAVLSGGTEIVSAGYRYHVFTADGVLTVTTPGTAEVLCVGGGAGGGSGCGGGGGGGDVRIATVNLVTASEQVTVGAGGAGGVAGAAGAAGEDSALGALVKAYGGGGGAGTGTVAGSRGTGGGGHGVHGAAGAGTPLRGYPGGPGGGYNLSAGGSAASAGGGGGAGDDGRVGAENETQGDELAEDWAVPTGYTVDVAAQIADQTVNGDRGLVSLNVSRGEMFVQGRVRTGHNDVRVGVAARSSHPGGVDAAPDGFYAWVWKGGNQFGINGAVATAFGVSLATWYTIQLYVADGVQQGHLQTDTNEVRKATADATYDGQNARSFGTRAWGGTNGIGRRQFDELMCFRSKWVIVGGVPTGGKAQVRNAAGGLVAEATEVAGVATIDCSRYGNGTTGAPEPVPAKGWRTLRVLNVAGTVVAELSTDGIYPGAELDVVAGALVFRDLGGGEMAVGVIDMETFNGLTPGPEHGDGGAGRSIPAEWQVAAPGDGGVFGGGGGGGAELFVAGLGGDGGGGNGSVDTAVPTGGMANTGGGGGGSGDAATPGASGGSGIVVVRTAL